LLFLPQIGKAKSRSEGIGRPWVSSRFGTSS
jgi:hypothetical protein